MVNLSSLYFDLNNNYIGSESGIEIGNSLFEKTKLSYLVL